VQSNKNIKNGFTLIEIMIVISIIGILTVVAIPNFISYRDKTFCSSTESDLHTIAGGLADYFAIPENKSFSGCSGNPIIFPGSATIILTGLNTGTITPLGSNTYRITVTDQSGRCPLSYRNSDPHWSGGIKGVYSTTLQ
jgi:type IV pilus assembly protein PilA